MTDDRSSDDDDEYWQHVREADVTKPTGHEPTVKEDPDEVRRWAEERDAVPVTDLNATGPGAFALRHENEVEGSTHERVTWDDFATSFRDEDMAFHHTDEDDEAGTHRFVRRSDAEGRSGGERTDADRGVAGTAEDEGRPAEGGTGASRTAESRSTDDHSDEAEPDIGAADTETTTASRDRDTEMTTETETTTDTDAGSGRTGAAADRDADEGTVVGDREGGVESGIGADADAGRTGTETGRTDTGTGPDADAGRTETDARGTETGMTSDTDLLADVSQGDSVVDDQGETVGLVTAVEGSTLFVDPDPGLTEKLSAKLGWVDQDDAEYTIDASDVASVEGGNVRLR